jgi:uncharacterized integral membrane protein
MTEPKRGSAAERETPEVPPMRAGGETPAVPVVPGGAAPGGGAVEPLPTDATVAGADLTEPDASRPGADLAAPVHLKRTRISGLWVGITVAAVVLLLLLVFILQNNITVTINYFGWSGDFPLGVALLLSAICGVLLVAVPGYGRIIQLRRAAHRAGRRQ